MQTKPLYLNNQWVPGGAPLAVENPATGEIIAQVATVNSEYVNRALSDAQAALEEWRNTTAKTRGDYLLAIGAQLEARREEIAKVITQENGKPLAESRGEVNTSIDHLRWFAEQGRRAYGRLVPQQTDNKRHLILKTPIGVVGAIAPWNFPLVLPVRKMAPALAAGCPVVLKPAPQTPLSSLLLARAVEQARLPKGLFQVVLGNAKNIGQQMLENPICRKISFTGSTRVGQELIRGAATTVTRLSLELGGHAPVMVFDDADIKKAVEGIIMAKFRNTGQSCIAANRVYVQRSIYDQFVAELVSKVKKLKVGNGLDENVEVGAMINKVGLNKALKHIEDAVSRGSRCLAGGNPCGDTGYFLKPTVLVDVDDDALCMQEETFAPVLPITVFNTEQEAIAKANNTKYGLAAYAFTSNLNRALRISEQLEAGTIGINDGIPSTSNCPFGGVKQSGWGRELGEEGLDAFLETKHISIADTNI